MYPRIDRRLLLEIIDHISNESQIIYLPFCEKHELRLLNEDNNQKFRDNSNNNNNAS